MNDIGINIIGRGIKILYLYIVSINKIIILRLMTKKKKQKKTNVEITQRVVEQQQQPEKNNTLILGGLLVAMTSIGLLIFVLSDKVFHLN